MAGGLFNTGIKVEVDGPDRIRQVGDQKISFIFCVKCAQQLRGKLIDVGREQFSAENKMVKLMMDFMMDTGGEKSSFILDIMDNRVKEGAEALNNLFAEELSGTRLGAYHKKYNLCIAVAAPTIRWVESEKGLIIPHHSVSLMKEMASILQNIFQRNQIDVDELGRATSSSNRNAGGTTCIAFRFETEFGVPAMVGAIDTLVTNYVLNYIENDHYRKFTIINRPAADLVLLRYGHRTLGKEHFGDAYGEEKVGEVRRKIEKEPNNKEGSFRCILNVLSNSEEWKGDGLRGMHKIGCVAMGYDVTQGKTTREYKPYVFSINSDYLEDRSQIDEICAGGGMGLRFARDALDQQFVTYGVDFKENVPIIPRNLAKKFVRRCMASAISGSPHTTGGKSIFVISSISTTRQFSIEELPMKAV